MSEDVVADVIVSTVHESTAVDGIVIAVSENAKMNYKYY